MFNTPSEFTGERIIPGAVDVNLANEHAARYAFAAEFAKDKRVLDAGCGSGYGSAELAAVAREVVGVDNASEAIDHASAQYQGANLRFERGSCEALPAGDGSFDLVTAFEVIEHLEKWPEFLREARRALAPAGLLLLSTPNKNYYAESRRTAGPNPFHVHEFEFAEFQRELSVVFPFVKLFAQNHTQGVVFTPVTGKPSHAATAAVRSVPELSDAHFFVALCGVREVPGRGPFVYVPDAGNLLWQREQHIALLENEVRLKTGWLAQRAAELAALNEKFTRQKEELERSNRWAEGLNEESARRGERIQELQSELDVQREGYESKLGELHGEIVARTEWALATERRLEQDLAGTAADLAHQIAELGKCVTLLDRAEATVRERTEWAQRVESDADELRLQLAMLRQSRWMKLGRKLGMGPRLPG